MLGSSAALADIHVQHLIGANWSTDDQTLTSGTNVNVVINDSTSGTYRVFVDDETSEDIGTITINSQSTGTPTLFVGTGRTTPTEAFRLDIAGCRDLVGIAWSGGKPRLQAYVYRDVTDDISMWHIVRIDIGNELQGNVTHGGGGVSPAPRLGFISALRIIGPSYYVDITAEHGDVHRVETMDESYAHVTSDNGSIDEIEATTVFLDGGWYGDVLAPNGSIGTVRCPNGGIGFLGEGKVRIEAKNGIDKVFASGDIHADIKSNVNSGSGVITSLRTTPLSVGGFTGTVQTPGVRRRARPVGRVAREWRRFRRCHRG